MSKGEKNESRGKYMNQVYLKSKTTNKYLTMGDYETPLIEVETKDQANPMSEAMAFSYAAMDDDIELEEIEKEKRDETVHI